MLKPRAIPFLVLLAWMWTGSLHADETAAESIKEHPSDSAEENQTLTVAVLSSRSVFGDVDANIKHFERLMKEAAARGARLVCFPELALTAYATSKEILGVAEPVPGRTPNNLPTSPVPARFISPWAWPRRTATSTTLPSFLSAGYIGRYRKHHPTGPERACGFWPGKEFPVWDVDGFKLGINICADGRNEGTIKAMKEAEVDVIHHPHGNWLPLGKDAEEWTRGKMVYFVPRATFSRAYILINNSAGDTELPEGVSSFGSGALAIDPLGQVMDRTTQKDREEKMIIVTLKKPLSSLIPPFEMARLQRGK